MRPLLALVLLLSTGCTGGATATAARSATAATSRPTAAAPTSGGRLATPSAAPSPTPAVRVSITPAGRRLACRLPVTWSIPVEGGTEVFRAGFLTFPAGQLTEDTTASSRSGFYDRALSRWLPVPRDSVSPDGKEYAYTDGDVLRGDTKGSVHVVDVTTGADRVVYRGSPIFYVVDFATEGIYLSASPGEAPGTGLWLENPAGGAPRVLNSAIYAPSVGAQAAWGLEFNPADKHPAPGGITYPKNQLVRFDLATGAKSVWFYLAGADIEILGFDAGGHPLVTASVDNRNETHLWLISTATISTRLYAANPNASQPNYLSAVDRHGVWFSGSFLDEVGSVWLYTAGSTYTVATATGSDWLNVAGGCIP